MEWGDEHFFTFLTFLEKEREGERQSEREREKAGSLARR
jgi:hypothetical protein